MTLFIALKHSLSNEVKKSKEETFANELTLVRDTPWVQSKWQNMECDQDASHPTAISM